MKHFTQNNALVERLLSGQFPTVFIDDTGTAGAKSGSKHISSNRKTWVSICLSGDQTKAVFEEMPGVIAELSQSFGIEEIHCSEILNRTGSCSALSSEQAFGIFEFFVKIFQDYKIPIIVQTFDPGTIQDHVFTDSHSSDCGFNLNDPNERALLFLLIRTKWYLNKTPLLSPAYFFIDEGVQRSNTRKLVGFTDVMIDGFLNFHNSKVLLPLQLADFAAFMTNRTQWVLGKEKRSQYDDIFLQLASMLNSNFVNLEPLSVDLSTWSPEDYDSALRNDRIAKGLNADPLPVVKKKK